MNSKAAIRTLCLALLMSVGFACERNEPQHPNQHVNDWIYDNLKFWYYWTDEIPADPDKSLDHKEFFESLLSDKDRFSWIEENYQELLNSLQGVEKEPGYEYALYREAEGSNNVIMQILYVKPNSPASNAGLKRGDLIIKINSEQITVDNYKTLVADLGSDHTVSYRSLDIATKTFAESQTVSMSPVVYSENPNYLNKVFTYDNHRVGYYVYNFFSNGTSGAPDQYKNQMDQIFSTFQSQFITDLIIDLRFNSGGAESSARNLASLIGRDVNATKLFVTHEYNKEVKDAILKDPNLGASFLNVYFDEKSQNVGGLLNGARVYILTGSRTASASELIINGLRPYMEVYLIGNTTIGKNLGSISIYDKEDPENSWGMQPIVTKLLNSENKSDYDHGFTPQQLNTDNSLYLYPLGDPKETLLNLALQQITGSPVIGRLRDRNAVPLGEPIGHSLDLKKRSGRVVLDPVR